VSHEWILGKTLIIVLRGHEMLMINDQGFNKHQGRQLAINAATADLMRDLLYNLHRHGKFHTFICEHGQTHRINLQMGELKVA
jgi:hypothetical protein